MTYDRKDNPYTNPKLHETKPEPPVIHGDREPLNGALRHVDIVSGHQVPKRLDQVPSRLRKVIRLAIIVYVVLFGAALVLSLFKGVVG